MHKKVSIYAQKTIVSFTAVTFLAGCATASKYISPSYVSPLQYQSYDCGQLISETQRIQGRYVELGGRLDQAASNDAAIMGVGLLIFWPALFALGGTKQQEAEYGRLRGEFDAVQKTSIEKKCNGQSPTAVVAAPSVLAASLKQ